MVGGGSGVVLLDRLVKKGSDQMESIGWKRVMETE